MTRMSCSQKWGWMAAPLLLSALLFTQTSAAESGDDRTSALPKKQAGPAGFYRALEINYIILNAADLVTTFHGLDNGAQETNPIARAIVGNKPVAVAAKAGFTIGALWALRQAWKHDRRAASITLIALNVVYGAVVTNNIRVSIQVSR